jgi:hypothetical protein
MYALASMDGDGCISASAGGDGCISASAATHIRAVSAPFTAVVQLPAHADAVMPSAQKLPRGHCTQVAVESEAAVKSDA